jgi:hypothetical protein
MRKRASPFFLLIVQGKIGIYKEICSFANLVTIVLVNI